MVGGGAVFVRQTTGFSFQIFRWVMTPDPDFLMGGSDLFTTAMVWGWGLVHMAKLCNDVIG